MFLNFPPSTASRKIGRVAMLSSLALVAAACNGDTEQVPVETESTELAMSKGGDWIRLDGAVASSTPASPDSFVLDYGSGRITVKTDEWDLVGNGIVLRAGDRVSVTGRINEGFFNTATINADALYVRALNTVFFASPDDERELGLTAAPRRPDSQGVDYTGWVAGTTDSGFTLGDDSTRITVSTKGLESPDISADIEAGDRVYVWGDLTIAANGESKLIAKGLMELTDGSERDVRKSGANPSG